MIHSSISGFTLPYITSKSCFVSDEKLDVLKKYVKMTAMKQNVHANTIWARLKKKYGFKRYKEIKCPEMEAILNDLQQTEFYPVSAD